jgi:hypothetical protein
MKVKEQPATMRPLLCRCFIKEMMDVEEQELGRERKWSTKLEETKGIFTVTPAQPFTKQHPNVRKERSRVKEKSLQ